MARNVVSRRPHPARAYAEMIDICAGAVRQGTIGVLYLRLCVCVCVCIYSSRRGGGWVMVVPGGKVLNTLWKWFVRCGVAMFRGFGFCHVRLCVLFGCLSGGSSAFSIHTSLRNTRIIRYTSQVDARRLGIRTQNIVNYEVNDQIRCPGRCSRAAEQFHRSEIYYREFGGYFIIVLYL